VKPPVDIHEFLKQRKIPYRSLVHSPRFTAQEVAQASHVTGYELAKVVVASADGKMVLAVLPAPRRLSVRRLATALGAKEVRLASEEEFAPLFPGCEKGAMPPFGDLYGVPMVVDPELSTHPEIAFNACSHTETLAIRWADYEKAVRPKLAPIAEPEKTS
jgi:Ala-tRNA(Pro) deacylase